MSFFRYFIFFILLTTFTSYPTVAQEKTVSKNNTNAVVGNTEKNNTCLPEQIRNKQIISLSFVMIILLFFLFYFFYQNNKLRQKIKRKDAKQKILLNVINAGIDSQEVERKKIASFLHDNINSLLSSVGLHLKTFTTLNDIKSDEIQKAKSILQEAHDLLRDMSHDLVPTLLVRFGLIYALEDLCERNSNSHINFKFSSTISTEKRYIEKFEMKLYFIVSELFNNIIKHSDAQKAKIFLSEKNNQFIIVIQDNGKGFETQRLNNFEGFGINRIRARIKKYKGSISITSKANEGTTVKIKVPLPF
ncbi:sensor histidine kinase [Flavobacterium sp. B183]|uniref:sensor histidine kinase n=1 Tax=Flavobacterium sp. B183 TaxID=907046 RepID=UPI00201FAA1C|nr:ATP-binding protein [Flavobacterium sp. B183]URC12415.1 ATP-binding protein [Flavobacterium sp. B183]